MSRYLTLAAIVALSTGGCKARETSSAPPARPTAPIDAAAAAQPKPAGTRCRKLPFTDHLPVAEASGAVVVSATPHRPGYLLVVGDSGTRGAFNEVDLGNGRVLRQGRLPLDARASDDLEGLTRIGDTIYAVTSSGWVRHWRRGADGRYTLTQPAYPLANPHRHPRVTCTPTEVNCGRNYEALCAVADAAGRPAGSCIGFVGSKRTGKLYCLVLRRGRLRAKPSRKLRVTGRARLTGCHFDGDLLYAGMNLFGVNEVVRIRGWADPATAKLESLGSLGRGFAEALAAGPGGVIYRLSDMGGAPSLVDKYKCE